MKHEKRRERGIADCLRVVFDSSLLKEVLCFYQKVIGLLSLLFFRKKDREKGGVAQGPRLFNTRGGAPLRVKADN